MEDNPISRRSRSFRVQLSRRPLILLSTVPAFLAVVAIAFFLFLMHTEGKRNQAYAEVEEPPILPLYRHFQEGRAADIGSGEKDTRSASKLTLAEIERAENNFSEFEKILMRQREELESDEEWREALKFLTLWEGPLTALEFTFLRRVLDRHEGLIDEIIRIAPLGAPTYPLDFGAGAQMEMPHLSRMREFVRILSASARLEAHDGNSARAIASLVAAMQLGAALNGEPTLIGQMVRIALYAIVHDSIGEVVLETSLTKAETDLLLTSLEHSYHRDGLALAFQGETLLSRHGFKKMRHDFVSPLIALEFAEDGRQSFRDSFYGSRLGRPWMNLDEVSGVELFRTWIALTDRPFYDVQSSLQEVSQSIDGLPALRMMTKITHPTIARTFVAQARHETMIDLARLGLLIELYISDTGTPPPSLFELGEYWKGELPLDPFSGEPYHYSVSGDEYLLYGIGMNQQDDNGVYGLRNADMVWRGRSEDRGIPVAI